MSNTISKLSTDIAEIPWKKTESKLHCTPTPQILFNYKTSQKL